MRASQEAKDLFAGNQIGIEYIYAICMPEEWPLIKKKYDIITEHPQDPLLCIGYEANISEVTYAK